MKGMIIMSELVKAPWGINANGIKEELNVKPKIDLTPSFIFVPGTVNIFTDAAKDNSYSNATISNCITITGCDGKRAMFPSETRHISASTSTEAEISGVIYSLMKFNDSGISANLVNIFTDSLHTVNILKPQFYSMNGMFMDNIVAQRFISDLEDDPKVTEHIVLLCEERLRVKAPVNIWYVKAHTRDIMLSRSKFAEVNKESICVGDAISINSMNTFVDTQVSLYSRCAGVYEQYEKPKY